MKVSHTGIVAVILMVLAIAFAGCSGTSSSSAAPAGGSAAQATTGAGAAPAAATTAAASSASSSQVGSSVSSSSVFGGSYTWMEYKTTSSYSGTTTTMDTKTERSTGDYKGTPAIHMKMTMTSSQGMNSVYDVYYDTSMKNVLGGTMTMTVNGQTITQDIPASQLQNMQSSGFTGDYSLTYAGVEPVSVPAGTYPAANKYTASRSGTDTTYWVATGVPVPVKYASSSSQGSSTAELVGWG